MADLQNSPPVKGWEPVLQAINALPEPQKKILVMRVFEARAFDEIALAIDQPVEDIKVVFYRNMDKIMKQLKIKV